MLSTRLTTHKGNLDYLVEVIFAMFLHRSFLASCHTLLFGHKSPSRANSKWHRVKLHQWSEETTLVIGKFSVWETCLLTYLHVQPFVYISKDS
jgi:hypothetical protein